MPKVCHTVFFRLRDDAPQEAIAQFFSEMGKLKTEQKIEGILSFSYGAHNGNESSSQGFTHGMSFVFADVESRDIYIPHPEHKRIKTLITPLLKDASNSIIALDWYL